MEKKKPGTVSELFRSHPNVASRIKNTQKNLQESLKEQPLYVVTTSEFFDLRRDVTRAMNQRKSTPEQTGPTLRRHPKGATDGAGNSDGSNTDSEDERPTLQRRES